MPELFKPAPNGKAPPAAPSPVPDGLGFAGMDRAAYPGDRVMESLIKNTNLEWTGYYLTPAPSHGRQLGWMDKHDFLRGLGWGIAPIYVGRQQQEIDRADHRITPENGKIDGADAARLALAARIAVGSFIFLDFENGPPFRKDTIGNYYAAWAKELRNRGFQPAVYCLSGVAAGLAATVPGAPVWAVNLSRFPKKVFQSPYPTPDPVGSGVTGATMWQLKQALTIEYEDIGGGIKRLTPVDLDSSRVADPSGIGRRAVPKLPRVLAR